LNYFFNLSKEIIYMKNAKKLLGLLVVAACPQTTVPKNQEQPVHQHSSTPITVPSIVDGTRLGINGHEIRKLIFIMREVEKLMYGVVVDTATKVKRGQYLFKDMHHCIASLAELEIENLELSPAERTEFKRLLNTVIDDFIRIATPFVEQARGVKSITLGFMKEWAEKHDAESSLLLNWAKEKDGHEFDTFKRDINSFDKLYNFCQDLNSFLSDLIQSCPRAWEQFLALQKKK